MPKLMSLTQNRYLRWCAAIGWTLFLCLLLLQPEAKPVVDLHIPPGPPSLKRELAFAAVHVAAFSVMAGLWWWALIENLPMRRALIGAFMIAMAIGLSTELLQTLTLDRIPSLLDLAADAVGGIMPSICYRIVEYRRIKAAAFVKSR